MSNHQSELPGEILDTLKRLGTSLTNHAHWLKILHRSLICGEQAPANDLKKDAHHHCAFGRWYYSEPDSNLRSLPQYEQVGELHQQVHDEARNLLNLRQAGQEITTGDYEAFMAVAHEFRSAVQNLQFDMFSQVCAVDHLTGVWNRYALSHKLSQEFQRVQRTSLPCSIAMLDFDHFKRINDSHGHLVGDQVLKSVVEYFLSQLRQYDNIFRYGGEEFVLMFPATDLKDAESLLQRISDGLKSNPVNLENGKQITVTVSIGLAVMDGSSSERETLEAADCALLSAKLSGRDCIQLCT